MPTSTRIKANALTLTIDSVEYTADFSSVVLQSEEASADVTTFYDASVTGGRRDFYFTVAGVQSTETTSFWRAMWDDAGTEVPFIFAPNGGVAGANTPHFTGTVRLPARGALMLGGDASPDGTFAFDGVRMDIVGDITLDVTP